VLANITFYSFVLFIHVAAVVLAFGVTFTYALLISVTRQSYERHLPYLHRIQALIGERFVGPLGGLILLAGIYLAIKGPYDFSEPWVGIGILIIVVLLATGGAYFGPREKRLAELPERDIEASPDGPVSFSAEYEQLLGQVRTVGLVANGLVLLAIFFMVTKP
jgi:uncharacterized membrane protein